MKKQTIITVILVVLVMTFQAFGSETTDKVAMSSIAVMAMNKTIQADNEFDIYVLGSKSLSESFIKYLGQNVGDATLMSVANGSELPINNPAVLIFTDGSRIEEVREYCRKNKVLSISNNPEFCEQGISLGIGMLYQPIFENKYSLQSITIALNETASNAECMEWYSQIHDVTTPVTEEEILAMK